MKRFLHIILITIAAVVANVCNVSAQSLDRTPGQIKFKFNIKNVNTLDPVPGAYVVVHIKCYNQSSRQMDRLDLLTTLPAGNDGVSYGTVSYTPNANQGAYLNGLYIWAPGSGGNQYVNQQTIDLDPLPSSDYGYALPPPVNGRVRNLVSCSNATKTHSDSYGGFDNCYLSGNWLTQGATIEFDVFVQEFGTTKTISFDTSQISNASSFTSISIEKGSVFNVSSITATPVCTDSDYEFDYWSLDGTTKFESATISSSLLLKPVWKLGPDVPTAKGIIHFKVYLWDHDKYWKNPKTSGGTVLVNGVPGHYSAYDYKNNSGWTDIPIQGMKFILKSYDYYHVGGVGDSDKIPVGKPASEGLGSSYVITGTNGCGTYEIPNENLKYLRENYIIDTDPDQNHLAQYDRGLGFGLETTAFDWDWVDLHGDHQGAGLVGVRYILEGERHDNNGKIHISDNNDNDVIRITKDMIKKGFEMTFVCYVVPSCMVTFDINGGTGISDSNIFPLQKFDPVNSIGGPNSYEYRATNPGTPTKAGKVFAGWYEVFYDESGNETGIASEQFDFTRVVTYSMTLRAKYSEKVYAVRWAPDTWNWTSESGLFEIDRTYESGAYPTFDSALPTKEPVDPTLPYVFKGWDVYEAGAGNDKSFGGVNYGKVAFITQNEMEEIADGNNKKYYKSPRAVGTKDLVYVANFHAETAIKIVKKGLKSGDSSIFTITDGNTTYSVVLKGNGSDVSQTVKVTAGTWTVSENSWSWAYTAQAGRNIVVNDGDIVRVEFTNTAKTSTPGHAESSVNNIFGD